MTLDEFQIWFQAYLTGLQASALSPARKEFDIGLIIQDAHEAANMATAKYSLVQKPQAPSIDTEKFKVDAVLLISGRLSLFSTGSQEKNEPKTIKVINI